MELLNLITTKDLNGPTLENPDSMLLHLLIDDFDPYDKYSDLLNSIFKLKHVDPQLVNINKKNPRDGTTALMLAAIRGNLELVTTLIYWNADPHAISTDRMAALTFACDAKHVEVARYLSKYVTREELELKPVHTRRTVKAQAQIMLKASPDMTEYDSLLEIIQNIEIRHLVEERI